MTTTCAAPLAFDRIVAYLVGELDGADEDAVEAHAFSCDACARAVEEVQALVAGLEAMIPPVVTGERLAQLRDAEVRVRETPVRPGETVDIWFGDDVDVMCHVLHVDVGDVERVDMELAGPDAAIIATMEAVPVDAGAGLVRVACQRHFQNLGPDDICFRLIGVGGAAGERRVLGEYVVRHHWL